MKPLIYLFCLVFLWIGSHAQPADDNLFEQNRTYSHAEIIKRFARLAADFPEQCRLETSGLSDVGIPLHLFVINTQGNVEPETNNGNLIVFINNAIHPGEPCGVDASYKLASDILRHKKIKLPENITLCIVPMFNIGGAINRSCCSRANQNGPEEYGFRGNGQNLDLNRDFVKLDSKNTQSIIALLRAWDPHIFIDTHTSNGADYQHVMTLITTQKDKIGEPYGSYLVERMEPFLFAGMDSIGYPMAPYMHSLGSTPETGVADYLETPRYSTGYTSLFGSLSFVSEAHMLKPYKERVVATYHLLDILLEYARKHRSEIMELKNSHLEHFLSRKKHPLSWQLDSLTHSSFTLLGYEPRYKPSEVTGSQRLYYDRSTPTRKDIFWYRNYIGQDSTDLPAGYIVPQAWHEVVERLKINKVKMTRLTETITIPCEVYTIEQFETTKAPYEGHYLHSHIEVSLKDDWLSFHPGDYVIDMNQEAARFIMEVLEPHGVDSYFAWNFFDPILQQKEWFSSYVFEDEAARMLSEDAALKAEFDQKKLSESEFANSPFNQLYWLYTRSNYYEPSHNRYPVVRITKLP